MTFGQYIRQERTHRNLSQDTLAQALGFEHRSNIHRLETDKLEWKLSSVEKLARLFDTTASQLIADYEAQR